MRILIAAQPDEFPADEAARAVRSYTTVLDLLPYLALGIVVMVIGAAAVWWVRRRVRSGEPEGPIARGASLSTFRRMRDRGELSEQEYQAIRRNLVDQMRDEIDV